MYNTRGDRKGFGELSLYNFTTKTVLEFYPARRLSFASASAHSLGALSRELNLNCHRSRPAPRTPVRAQSTSVLFTLTGAPLLFLLLRPLARLLATSPASAHACVVACLTASYLTRFCGSSRSRSLPCSPPHLTTQQKLSAAPLHPAATPGV